MRRGRSDRLVSRASMDNFQHAGLSIDLPPAQAAAESRPLPKFNREASSHVKLDVETNPIKKAQQWMAMPDDDPQANIHTIDDDEPLQRQTKEAGTRPKQKQSIFDTLFAIPAPLKPIFDRVPLLTYPANDLPLRSPRKRGENVLHVFTTLEDAKIGRPSFNPACLKWQAYLKFTGIPFTTGPSTNHASPSGALPYLQPAVSTTEPTKQPIPSNKLKRWIAAQNQSSTPHKEPEDPRHEAYASLLDHRIRRAWVTSPSHTLPLTNHTPLTSPILSSTNSTSTPPTPPSSTPSTSPPPPQTPSSNSPPSTPSATQPRPNS